MELKIGVKIKELRISNGYTQEELAEKMGVTFQAVSKWETGATTPDIALLPELALLFGITMDELFSLNHDDYITRIENMIRDESHISTDSFMWAERYLKGILADEPYNNKVRILLAELYSHRENSDSLAQARLCEEGLKIDPYDKALNGQLFRVLTKRQEEDKLIKFYEKLLANNYDNTAIVGNLTQLYIKCRAFDKAKTLISKAENTRKNIIHRVFEGDVELAQGNDSRAKSLWLSVSEAETTDHTCVFELSERFNKIGDFKTAIELYEKAYDMQNAPKELDALYSLAFLYTKLDEKAYAIAAWERIIVALAKDYHIHTGEAVDWVKREIEKRLFVNSWGKNKIEAK